MRPLAAALAVCCLAVGALSSAPARAQSCTVSCSNITMATTGTTCDQVVNIPIQASSGCVGQSVTLVAPGAVFAGGGASLTLEAPLPSSVPVTFPVGVTAATIQVGASNVCSFSVTVNDGTPPTLTCPSSPQTFVGDAECSAVRLDFPLPVAHDNCGIAGSLTQIAGLQRGGVIGSPASGTFQECFRTTDTAGLGTSCCFALEVDVHGRDTTPPVIQCPGDLTFAAAPSPSCDGALVTYELPTVTDHCETSLTLTSGIGSGERVLVGGTYQTCYQATDDGDNTSSCCFDITVTTAGFDLGAEVCDGVDNDCNGSTDDIAWLGQPCSSEGDGPCTAGTWTCEDGVEACRPYASWSGECTLPGSSACAFGFAFCENGVGTCEPYEGTLGTCTVPGSVDPCTEGTRVCSGGLETCVPKNRAIPGSAGVCRQGTAPCDLGRLRCRDGALVCTPNHYPVAQCSLEGVGACGMGLQWCTNFSLEDACQPMFPDAPWSTAEACDETIDWNCDGITGTPTECQSPGGQVFFGEMMVPAASGGSELKAFRCAVASPGAEPVCDTEGGVLKAYPPLCQGAVP